MLVRKLNIFWIIYKVTLIKIKKLMSFCQDTEQNKSKREQFANMIRSEQRRKIFAQRRVQFEEAKRREDDALIN